MIFKTKLYIRSQFNLYRPFGVAHTCIKSEHSAVSHDWQREISGKKTERSWECASIFVPKSAEWEKNRRNRWSYQNIVLILRTDYRRETIIKWNHTLNVLIILKMTKLSLFRLAFVPLSLASLSALAQTDDAPAIQKTPTPVIFPDASRFTRVDAPVVKQKQVPAKHA